MPHAHASGFPPRALDYADASEGQALALRAQNTAYQALMISQHGEGQALALRARAKYHLPSFDDKRAAH